MSYKNSDRTSRRKISTSSFHFLSFPHFVLSLYYFFSFIHCFFIGKLKKKSTNMADTFIVRSKSTRSSKRYLSVTEYCLSASFVEETPNKRQRRCTYSITLWRVRVTIVARETQQWVLSVVDINSVAICPGNNTNTELVANWNATV